MAGRIRIWAHTGYRTVFYLFYLTANALAAHFILVFVAGLFLYGLEQFYLFMQMSKTIHGINPQIRKS